MRVALIVFLLLGPTGAACAQDAARQDKVTIDGVARATSLMRQMIDACADRLEIDRDMAGRYVKAFTEIGDRAFGRKAFARALAREFPRRAAEVRDIGADVWCPAQRQRVIEMGGEPLFRK
jgi:hypothetical protein